MFIISVKERLIPFRVKPSISKTLTLRNYFKYVNMKICFLKHWFVLVVPLYTHITNIDTSCCSIRISYFDSQKVNPYPYFFLSGLTMLIFMFYDNDTPITVACHEVWLSIEKWMIGSWKSINFVSSYGRLNLVKFLV